MNSQRAIISKVEGNEMAPVGAVESKLPVQDANDADCLHSVLFRWGDVIKALDHFHVR
jgi:hypothetical protein